MGPERCVPNRPCRPRAKLLIRETLIPRDQWSPFYQMLIARSAGLTRYDVDSAYTAQLQKSWNGAGAEEALDHETLSLLKRTGCTYLVYAPESGSPNTLRKIKKKIHYPDADWNLRGSLRGIVRRWSSADAWHSRRR